MTQKLFAIDLGQDFAHTFVDGLLDRFSDRPPQDLAKAHVIVNTSRMQRHIRDALIQRGALLHPKMHLVTDISGLSPKIDRTLVQTSLAMRLELVKLVTLLIDQEPDIAARSSVFDLADSLANLIDEIQGEGVSPTAIADLDVTDQSGHWARAQRFFNIVQTYVNHRDFAPDPQTALRRQVLELAQNWVNSPVLDPVFLAGSTGSRGTTLELMRAVAALPGGAVILPGYDRDMPKTGWEQLSDPMRTQDHPQYRLGQVARILGHDPFEIPQWSAHRPVNRARTGLVSLALRPAPITDTWLAEGPNLTDLPSATQGITWVEAHSKRAEAMGIALYLRRAVETGETVAVITPDRQLTRQITAALSFWNITPDDSAGTPLQLSPPGRFLRQIANILYQPLTTGRLLALLKHPLTHSAGDRGNHLLCTRELELYLRRQGIPFPTNDVLTAWSAACGIPDATEWAEWLARTILTGQRDQTMEFSDWIALHTKMAEAIAAGAIADQTAPTGELWKQKAGQQTHALFATLSDAAHAAPPMAGRDYFSIFSGILSQGSLREFETPHSNIVILGTLESRVQSADTIILASLNEGTWPEAPAADPWLNRAMRLQAGLLLPDRKIGLSAHDFQSGLCHENVWITRSVQSDDAQTVPSRWINRLSNLLNGLPDQGGVEAINTMRARGQMWLDLVDVMDHAPTLPRAERPSTVVPPAARPTQLSVTEIKTLIRDPYSIYAKHILRLKPLDDLDKTPDAKLRGIIIHTVLETFSKDWDNIPPDARVDHLMALTQSELRRSAPWAVTQLMWSARMYKLADWFVQTETQRRNLGQPIAFEHDGKLEFPDIGFTLTTRADRIDAVGNEVAIYDYKTGGPPTGPQQMQFDKQLYLLAMMAQDGAFRDMDPRDVFTAAFISLSGSGKISEMPVKDEPIDTARAKFKRLIKRYQDPDQGYTARRALFKDSDFSNYDHLSRFGEWDVSDPARKERLS